MFDSSLCSLKGVFKPQLLIIYGISLGKNRTCGHVCTWTTSVTRSEQFFQREAASFEEQIKPKGAGAFCSKSFNFFFHFFSCKLGNITWTCSWFCRGTFSRVTNRPFACEGRIFVGLKLFLITVFY